MPQTIIIYKGKYGATRQYADWLGEAIQQPVTPVQNVTKDQLHTADFILLGSSVYIGKLLINEWIIRNAPLLKNKKLLLFVVCGNGSPKEQERIIKHSIPDGLIDWSDIFFLPGRLIFSKLSWKDKLLLKIGAMKAKNPETRKRMLQDVDNVQPELLTPLVNKMSVLHAAHSSAPTGI